MRKPSLPTRKRRRLTTKEISQFAIHLVELMAPAVRMVVVGEIRSLIIRGPRTRIAGIWIRVQLLMINEAFSSMPLHLLTLVPEIRAEKLINDKESARGTWKRGPAFLALNVESLVFVIASSGKNYCLWPVLLSYGVHAIPRWFGETMAVGNLKSVDIER